MNATTNTNQRLTTILLVLLITLLILLVILLVIGIMAAFPMMNGGMMVGMGGIMNDAMTNKMYTACIDMMRGIQSP